jgi:Holliday junction resolvase RusA-like endonuclease
MKYQRYEIEINEPITGKARPRMNTRTGRAYTPTKTKNYEYLTRFYFMNKYPDFEPLEGRLKVNIVAYTELPKSRTKIAEAEMLANIQSPTKKPDIDNIIKIILDSLNKFAYQDDRQITKLEIEKKYARSPKAVITIEKY